MKKKSFLSTGMRFITVFVMLPSLLAAELSGAESSQRLSPSSLFKQNLKTPVFVQAQRLHFLIHPGFLTDPSNYRDAELPDALWHMNRARHMFAKYLGVAGQMAPDELMFVVCHGEFGSAPGPEGILPNTHSALEAKKTEYEAFLIHLRELLGQRMVLIPSELGSCFPQSKLLELLKLTFFMKQKAKEQGFFWDRKTVLSETYGEVGTLCVHEANRRLPQFLLLNQPSQLTESLTDHVLYGRYSTPYSA